MLVEVGGDELDGRPIPTSVPNPTSPISIPVHPADHMMATDKVIEELHLEPSNGGLSPPASNGINGHSHSNGSLSKSPKSPRSGTKVFRAGGEKCLRPEGW